MNEKLNISNPIKEITEEWRDDLHYPADKELWEFSLQVINDSFKEPRRRKRGKKWIMIT